MKLENVADVYPLSPMQEGMLFHTIAEPESGVYVDQVVITLVGELQLQRLAESIRRVFAKCESLRTAFIWDGVDQPLQIVRGEVEFPVEIHDFQTRDENQQLQSLREIIVKNKTQPFELEQAPLIRAAICPCAENRAWLVFCFHHLILDGWSTHSLLERILDDYENGPREETQEFRFRDYIEWMINQDHQHAAEFWKQELAGFTEPNVIGFGRFQSSAQQGSQQQKLSLSRELSEQLRRMTRKNRVTLNTVMQAGWSLIVGCYSGSDDVVFGTTVAARPLDLDGIEQGIGSFINTIPFRTLLEKDLRLEEWLVRIQSQQAGYRSWEFSSLVQVQKQAEIPPDSSLFESILVFENYPASECQAGSIRIRNIEHFEQSNYPLAFLVVPADEIELIIISDRAKYSPEFVNRLLEHLQFLLGSFVEDACRPLNELLSRLPPEQRKKLSDWNQVEPDRANEEEAACIDQLIGQVTERNRDAIAAVFNGQTMTYGQLDDRSNQVARLLLEQGVELGEPVGLCVERSFEMLVGILGILKAGNCYVPLDVIYPQDHFQYVMDDAKIRVVLTSKSYAAFLPQSDQRKLVFFEELRVGDASKKPVQPESGNASDRLAYLIYTSGSTGKPKGVMISHQNLIHSTLARSEYYDHPPARFLLLSSFAFDSSVAGIFWTLCTGGALVLPKKDAEQDMVGLVELMQREKVTHLLCLPALYRLIAETAESTELDDLRVAIVAGESVSSEVVKQHFSVFPEVQLHNEYGPTEGTVWATAHRIVPADSKSSVPIGKPIANVGVLLLDQNRNQVPLGCVGEIYLIGHGVSPGYMNRPALTKNSFVSVLGYDGQLHRAYRTGDLGCYRDDGVIIFCGRADRQVKVRGYRIELGEIESTLASLEEVDEAVVIVQKLSASSTNRIHAFVTGDQLPNDRGYWINRLEHRLPEFMIPEVVMPLAEIPKLPNGKVDTTALPALESQTSRMQYLAPRTGVEAKLAAIWAETLGVAKVGIHDNFFSLGGDSIISIQVISRARREGIRIQPKHIAQYPTIAGLASIAESEPETESHQESTGPFPLTPIQQWFFEQNFDNPNHWNQSQLYRLPFGYDFEKLQTAVAAVVSAHSILRSRFEQTEDHWSQTISDEYSIAEISTLELAGDESASFDEACLAIQTSLDIRRGPLFRVVRFVNSGEQEDVLLFAAHHLVIDIVSWHILIDDIEAAYRDLVDGNEPRIGTVPCSCDRWCHMLHAQVANVEGEVDYWTGILASRPNIPFDYEARNRICENTVRTESLVLDKELTFQLSRDANRAYRTKLDDLLLSALTLTIAEWTNQTRVVMELENHGRDHEFGDYDLSRTVGWLTNSFPVCLTGCHGDLGETIRGVKEILRQMPNHGLGFGLLRYLNEETQVLLTRFSPPQILFNNLGTVRLRNNKPLLTPIDGAFRSSRDSSSFKTHPIEVSSVIVDDRLTVSIGYSVELHKPDTIKQLLDQLRQQIQAVVSHCVQKRDVSYTPSDFAESGLSQAELDEFLDEFD